jgi:hypothetical protein
MPRFFWALLIVFLLAKQLGYFPAKSKVERKSVPEYEGHRYGITGVAEEKAVGEKSSTRNFVFGGLIGIVVVWVFSYLRGGRGSSDELLCVVVPVGLLIGGCGGFIGVAICKKWKLEINHTIVSILGGLVASLILGGPAFLVALALAFAGQ